jgi:hypothetical protein
MEVVMKSIHSWNDLSNFGIVPLTGEACSLRYRILCDVTAQGKKTLEKALGVVDIGLAENWNHGSDADPHVGSIMLAREILRPFVGIFALLEAGCREVWLTKGNSLIGIESTDSDEKVDRFDQYHSGNLVRRFAYTGTAGDRNQHMMSGRVQ